MSIPDAPPGGVRADTIPAYEDPFWAESEAARRWKSGEAHVDGGGRWCVLRPDRRDDSSLYGTSAIMFHSEMFGTAVFAIHSADIVGFFIKYEERYGAGARGGAMVPFFANVAVEAYQLAMSAYRDYFVFFAKQSDAESISVRARPIYNIYKIFDFSVGRFKDHAASMDKHSKLVVMIYAAVSWAIGRDIRTSLLLSDYMASGRDPRSVILLKPQPKYFDENTRKKLIYSTTAIDSLVRHFPLE